MTVQRSRRLWLIVASQLVAIAIGIPNAGAHAAYESSNPEDGASVSSPPSQVTADFTEPVIDESYLQVIDPCGEQVDNGDSFVTADRISVSMSADKAGTYTVKFWVVSSVDGHNTAGEFTFSSSGGDSCVEEEPVERQDSSGSNGDGDTRRSSASTGGGGSGDESESTSGAAAASGNTRARADKGRTSNTRNGAAKSEGKGETARGKARRMTDQAAADFGPVELAQEPGPFDGMLWGAFAVGLALAALIGAAGGFVYAGIMGYTSNRS